MLRLSSWLTTTQYSVKTFTVLDINLIVFVVSRELFATKLLQGNETYIPTFRTGYITRGYGQTCIKTQYL